jgi:hypothetical protein
MGRDIADPYGLGKPRSIRVTLQIRMFCATPRSARPCSGGV